MPVYNLGRLVALKALVTREAFMPFDDLTRIPALNLFETSFQEIPVFLGKVSRSDGWPSLLAASAILVLMAFIFGTCMGLLVARLHRQQHNTMIVLYAVSILVTVVPNIGDFAVAAYSTGRFGAVFHFLLYSTNNTALIAGIVVAGFLNRRSGALPR